jgi:hypothetical protein
MLPWHGKQMLAAGSQKKSHRKRSPDQGFFYTYFG